MTLLFKVSRVPAALFVRSLHLWDRKCGVRTTIIGDNAVSQYSVFVKNQFLIFYHKSCKNKQRHIFLSLNTRYWLYPRILPYKLKWMLCACRGYFGVRQSCAQLWAISKVAVIVVTFYGFQRQKEVGGKKVDWNWDWQKQSRESETLKITDSQLMHSLVQ